MERLAASATGRRTPGTRQRRLAHGVAGMAVVVVIVLGAGGCSDDRIAAPRARADPDPATFVDAPADPAEDQQLTALSLPEDRPGTASAHTVEDVDEDLARLPDVLVELRRRAGDGTKAVRIDISVSIDVYVKEGSDTDQWTSGSEGRLTRTPLQRAGPSFGRGGRPFSIADVEIAAPRRVGAGIARRVPGAEVVALSLSTTDDLAPAVAGSPPGWLAWRFRVTRGGRSALVVAGLDGSVLEVRE